MRQRTHLRPQLVDVDVVLGHLESRAVAIGRYVAVHVSAVDTGTADS